MSSSGTPFRKSGFVFVMMGGRIPRTVRYCQDSFSIWFPAGARHALRVPGRWFTCNIAPRDRQTLDRRPSAFMSVLTVRLGRSDYSLSCSKTLSLICRLRRRLMASSPLVISSFAPFRGQDVELSSAESQALRNGEIERYSLRQRVPPNRRPARHSADVPQSCHG